MTTAGKKADSKSADERQLPPGLDDPGISKRERRRALTAYRRHLARRRLRRQRLMIAGIVVIVLAAGAVGIVYATRPPSISVSGAFGKAPTVSIPNTTPASTVQVHDLMAGHGMRLAKGDLAVARLTAYSWTGSAHAKISQLSTATPEPLTVGQTLPGLDQSLTGSQAGSRLLVTVPPKEGFGAQGNSQLKITGKDTLVLVVDILGTYNKTAGAHGQQAASKAGLPTVGTAKTGTAPPVHIASATKPPTTLQVQTLIQGKGPVVKKKQLLIAQYEGLIWSSGKVFDSSWKRNVPTGFEIGAGQVIKAWDTGLVGKRIGSRVLLVVPPAEGYGTQGNSQAGIKGTDTLVFVVDIVGAY